MNQVPRIIVSIISSPFIALGIYSLSLGVQSIYHHREYKVALIESQKEHYGPNLRRMWSEYADRHSSQLTDPIKILNMFDSMFDKRPLQVTVVGDTPIQLQIDIGKDLDKYQ